MVGMAIDSICKHLNLSKMETTGLTPNAAQVDEQFDVQSQTSIENSSISQTEPADADASAAADTVDTIDATDAADTSAATSEYAGKSRAELVQLLIEAVAERPVQNLRNVAESIKVAFYKIPRTDVAAQREAFVAAGGAEADFKPADDQLEARFKEVMGIYRVKRDAYIATMEQDKQANYDKKMAIIEELRQLVASSEVVDSTFAAFRDLQARWREVGVVPVEKVKDMWETYHHHVENFYDFIKINKELRDMDLKRNLEAKIDLCEQAEALMMDPSPTSAFHNLQKLHQQWRETGPVALEFKEQTWERFKEASSKVNKRHQEYFDGIKQEQERNLALKGELCVQVEEVASQVLSTRKEWGDASDKITEIQKVWKTIGFAPKKDNAKIYERFRAACDRFFEAKRAYFGGMKNQIQDNLQLKTELCVQAEAIVVSVSVTYSSSVPSSESAASKSDDAGVDCGCAGDSGSSSSSSVSAEQWKASTEAILDLQKRWKESGMASRRQGDVLWKRFRAACDKFFELKAQHYGSVDSKYAENLQAKISLLDELRGLAVDGANLTFDTLKEYQRRWSSIGFVPIKQKEDIAKQYKVVVDELFAILRGSERERKIENFKGRVANLKREGSRRFGAERERMNNQIRQMEADIQLWENNIGFFAKSKNAELLVSGVRRKIEQAREEITQILEKMKILDEPVASSSDTSTSASSSETATKADVVIEITPEVVVDAVVETMPEIVAETAPASAPEIVAEAAQTSEQKS